MISLESQVLERHLSIFADKTLLFAGGVNDDFPVQIQKIAKTVTVWSWYFDYANAQGRKSAVDFSPVCDTQVDVIVYYWTKNKAEVQFQLMQLLANGRDNQEILIVGENRCGVRSAEKMLSAFGDIGKIDSARRCGLYHFRLKKRPHFDINAYWKTYRNPKLDALTVYSLPGVSAPTN